MGKHIKNGVDYSSGVVVDQELSSTSLNPLTNKATTEAINELKDNPVFTGSLSLNRKADTTIGGFSVAEGGNTTASGRYSHAEGTQTIASGSCSHAEGNNTTASKDGSHAEGNGSKASGQYSHSENYNTEAYGKNSHAEGTHTVAFGENQHVQGKYNVVDTTGEYAHIVGNGTDVDQRKNIHTLDWSGNAEFAGDVKSTNEDGNTVSLNELNNKISNNNFSETIDLTHYKQGQLYTCLSDGYLYVYINKSSIIYRIYGSTGNNYIYNSLVSDSEITDLIFIKKGMRIEVRAIESDSRISFKPLI